MTKQELEDEIEQLRAENAGLRNSLSDAGITSPATGPGGGDTGSSFDRHRRSRGWSVLSAFLIIIGLVLAPASIVTSWANTQLTNTDAFVATFAPLAKDPAVQRYITDQVVLAVNDAVDIPKLTSDVFDGITQLGLPPAAASALGLLEAPAAQGIETLLQTTVTKLVASDAFANIWSQALRVSHEQLMATMQNQTNSAVTISGNGELGLQLGPIIDQAKSYLVAQGFTFASSIPTIQKTIVIATSDSLVNVQSLYKVATALGTWLIWISLAFLAGGVVLARRRMTALVATSTVLAVLMAALASGLAVGQFVFIALISPKYLPADVATSIYQQVVDLMTSMSVAVAVLAAAVAIVAWLTGPFRTTQRLRSLIEEGSATLRAIGDARHIGTGRFGEVLYAQRTLARVIIAVAASAIVLFTRPLTPALVIWTAVIALLVVVVLEILQRPPTADSTATSRPAGDTEVIPPPV
jgi:hypothetical protein